MRVNNDALCGHRLVNYLDVKMSVTESNRQTELIVALEGRPVTPSRKI